MKIDSNGLIAALRASWAADTAFDAADWNPENPARGHCLVSALVAQDYLGGDLQRYEVEGSGLNEVHHVNLLDHGAVLDTTASQYVGTIRLTPIPTSLKGFTSIRDRRLADESTRRRYEILKARVQSVLIQ